MSSPLLYSLLTGSAAVSPLTAGELFAACDHLPHLESALSMISNVIGSEDDLAFRDRFEEGYRTFQQSKDPLSVVRNDLAPLIAALPQRSWENIARRFGSVEQASENPSEPDSEPIRPRVSIKSPFPELARKIEDAFMPVLKNLARLSVRRDLDELPWQGRLFDSGLLEAFHVSVTADYLPEGSEKGLKVLWYLRGEKIPHIEVSLRKDCPLEGTVLLLAILQSVARETAVSLKAADLRREEGRSASLKKGVKLLRAALEEEGPPFFSALVGVQETLLKKKEEPHIRQAFGRLAIPLKVRSYLMKRLSVLQLRVAFRMNTSERGAPSHVNVRRRSPHGQLSALDRRRRETVFFEFAASRSWTIAAKTDEIWDLVAMAYARWEAEGAADKDYVPGLSLNNVSLHGKMLPLPVDPAMPAERSQEYADLFSWLQSVSRPRHQAGLSEIHEILGETELVEIRKFKPRIAAIRWIDLSKGGKPSIQLQPAQNSEVRWQASLHQDLKVLVDMNPIEVFEFAERALSRALVQHISKKTMLLPWNEARTMDVQSADHWTWLRLFWRYETLLAQRTRSPEGFQLLGGDKAKDLAASMVPALQRRHLTQPETVRDSLARHRTWVVDYTAVQKKAFEEGLREATIVSVLTARGAKLIHFNGCPHFDRDGWDDIARIVLAAPTGFTWFEPGSPWRTNRPELVAGEGDENWYQINARYSQVSADEKARYRAALRFVRSLAKADGKTQPAPQSTADDIKALYRALVQIHHPDKKGAAGIDTGGVFSQIQQAFGILEKFY